MPNQVFEKHVWAEIDLDALRQNFRAVKQRAGELPLCAVLARMEHAGMRVDANALAAFGSEMEVQLKTLEQHIYEEAGRPGSPCPF